MGSVPDGTMCIYCDAEEAGYIPDGLLGVTCGTCMDLASAHETEEQALECLDRLRIVRFLRSLRAVTGGQRGEGRRNPFYHLFLEEDALLGYGMAPFLIVTTLHAHMRPPRAAVAAPELSSVTEGSDDDGNDRLPLLWEDQWRVVMEAEDEASRLREAWTLDRVLPEWHTSAYNALRTPHGRTDLVQATQDMMRARYDTLLSDLSLRAAERSYAIARHNLRVAQRHHDRAVDAERQYDTGIRRLLVVGPRVENGELWTQPQWRLPERYESAWAVLAWMREHGPVGNRPARNDLAALYHAALAFWDRYQHRTGRTPSSISRRSALPIPHGLLQPRGSEEERWQEYFVAEERWQDAGPLEEDLQQFQQHYLRHVGPH